MSVVPSKLGIYRWKKMFQDNSVNPFTMQIFLHENLFLQRGKKVTSMGRIFFFLAKNREFNV